MKLTKENVCVFIEDKAQLEQARELLVKYDQTIFKDWFNLSNGNHLIYDKEANDWWLASSRYLINQRTIAPLTELEKIFSDGKETLQRNI